MCSYIFSCRQPALAPPPQKALEEKTPHPWRIWRHAYRPNRKG